MARNDGPRVLLKPKDAKRCKNKWVAVKSFIDNTVVGLGKTPDIALEKARKNGIENPVVFYVGILTQIY